MAVGVMLLRLSSGLATGSCLIILSVTLLAQQISQAARLSHSYIQPPFDPRLDPKPGLDIGEIFGRESARRIPENCILIYMGGCSACSIRSAPPQRFTSRLPIVFWYNAYPPELMDVEAADISSRRKGKRVAGEGARVFLAHSEKRTLQVLNATFSPRAYYIREGAFSRVLDGTESTLLRFGEKAD